MPIQIRARSLIALVHDTGCVALAHTMIDNPIADPALVPAPVLECLVKVADREVARFQPPAPRAPDPKDKARELRRARNRRHRDKVALKQAQKLKSALTILRNYPTPAEASQQTQGETL